MRTAALPADRKHPVFFDHPVDHLLGNLLVAGLLGLADEVAGGALQQTAGCGSHHVLHRSDQVAVTHGSTRIPDVTLFELDGTAGTVCILPEKE
ncbi:hypothetical protein [Dactylosporangium sp. NPDC051484]|uniref:hypothetical protein n=1 Tax=Dactylosporangium sp. NPDC051484 TaxID=3154942 RepID=UPI00344F02ED